MTYTEVKFTCRPNNEIVNSILSAEIAAIGFESFVESETGTTAYIAAGQFDEQALNQTLAALPVEAEITYLCEQIEDQNWNEEWEKNYFQPLTIDNRCIVQSSFHNAPAIYDYNILIDPKMAFGTGHHQTTELIIRQLLDMDLQGKSLLDMGCGTAILAILASMRHANPILAIDIDQWAYNNAIENLQLNHINNVEVKTGGAELLGDRTFDVILANINRNILLNDIPKYTSVLNAGGELYLSGFYTEDIPAIRQAAEQCGLHFCHYVEKDNWAAVKMKN
ncbi:MAG: 50S ribosomal protein L11 methyltransferase [Prevotella sp.]|jgi:ribosomal protein L11 methyltransferase|nr:50S ribosomal protein L11 methyltransferase [Prevotella sp.]